MLFTLFIISLLFLFTIDPHSLIHSPYNHLVSLFSLYSTYNWSSQDIYSRLCSLDTFCHWLCRAYPMHSFCFSIVPYSQNHVSYFRCQRRHCLMVRTLLTLTSQWSITSLVVLLSLLHFPGKLLHGSILSFSARCQLPPGVLTPFLILPGQVGFSGTQIPGPHPI